MKKLMIASACALALSMGGAFAQSQPAPGASSVGNVGPGATGKSMHGAKHATKHMIKARHASRHATKHMRTAKRFKEGTTTGMSSGVTTGMAPRRSKAANPSSQGNVGPGTDNLSGKQPGGR